MDGLALEIINELTPLLATAVATAASAYLSRLLRGRVDRETLHSAIESGVLGLRDALEDGKISRDEAVDLVLDYILKSSPQAVGRLKPSREVIERLAGAKMGLHKIKARF